MHLARNLGIEISEVKPGNYFVLRNSTARAAILGEASYLSHPAVEERLKLSAKQRLEAEAYFLGLVEYFSRGVPSISRLSPARDTIETPMEISFSVKSAAGVPLDPASARIRLGDRELVPVFEAASSVIRSPMPPDVPNGTHRLEASIRSARGATAWSVPASIVLERPPRHIIALPPVAKPGGAAAVSVRVLDERGMSVADGTPVAARFEKTGETFEGPCMDGTFTFEVARERAREPFTVSADGLKERMELPPLDEGVFAAFVAVDALTGNPVSRPVIGGGSAGSVIGDERGRILVPASNRPETLIVIATGYAPALLDTGAARGAAEGAIVRLSPLFGGALAGRRICLDPGGGGSDPGGRGAGSLRGASANLEVARILRNLLERAGASVALTRNGDETISPQERVYAANRADAELALGIRHEAPPAGIDTRRCVLYFSGSARGRSIAERLAAALGALAPEGPLAVVEWADVFLQQTACPACEVHCGPIEDASREAAMKDAAWLRLEAERIFAAIALSFGYEGTVAADFAVKVIAAGAPAAGASVDIDRLSVRATGAGGSASFGLVEPGAHLFTVRLADGRSALFARIVRPGETALVLEMP